MSALQLLQPDWPAPPSVRAYSTTRRGGVSGAPFDSLNLGDHVGDEPAAVASNRQNLVEQLAMPSPPAWLSQVHGVACVAAQSVSKGCEADASFTTEPNHVCVVMTADCLPLLFTNSAGSVVAAAHAGWRGLCDGVIESTVAAMGCPAEELLVWLGPAIGPTAFEVGEEVRTAFCEHDSEATAAFQPHGDGKWLADIYRLARQRLADLGVSQVYGGDHCTYKEDELFYSYRRDGQTGRMASLIWIDG